MPMHDMAMYSADVSTTVERMFLLELSLVLMGGSMLKPGHGNGRRRTSATTELILYAIVFISYIAKASVSSGTFESQKHGKLT
jgi:hypothetical protein